MKIFAKIFILFLFFSSSSVIAQQTWTWANGTNCSGNDYSVDVAKDGNGNVYVLGVFNNTLTLGSNSFTSQGANDIFVAKYSPTGVLMWAHAGIGNGDEFPKGIAIDNNNGVYITGYFTSPTLNFDGVIISANLRNSFLVKYNSTGTVQWGKASSGAAWEETQDIAIDGNNNIYICGNYQGQPITFDTSTLAGPFNPGFYLVKYNTSGNVQWARSSGIYNTTLYCYGIAANNNSIYLTGNHLFPEAYFGTDTITSNGLTDMFLTKYDLNGNPIWVESVGGPGDEKGVSVALTSTNDIYVAGEYTSADWGWGTNQFSNGLSNINDIFIGKLDTSATLEWVGIAGGTDVTHISKVDVDPSGNAYITGLYNSPVMYFYSFLMPPLNNTSSSENIYIARLNQNGNGGWALNLGNQYPECTPGIIVKDNSSLYAAGGYYATGISFGSGSVSLLNTGAIDMYLARLDGITSSNEMQSPTISVYPIPSSCLTTFQLPDDNVAYSMILSDISGKQVYISDKLKGTFQVDLSFLPQGIYIAELNNGKITMRTKLIKQ